MGVSLLVSTHNMFSPLYSYSYYIGGCEEDLDSIRTVHAIAVKTATSMCPLYIRSLHPPPAFFRRLYHGEDPSDSVGRRKLARKFILPQLGMKSASYSSVTAEREETSQPKSIQEGYCIIREKIERHIRYAISWWIIWRIALASLAYGT